jgi:hypothetical protein
LTRFFLLPKIPFLEKDTARKKESMLKGAETQGEKYGVIGERKRRRRRC